VKVFIDTSTFIALLNADDRFHLPAKQAWQEMLSLDSLLITNNYVLVETVAILQNRFGIEAVQLFHKDVLPVLDIFWIDELTHAKGESAMLAASRRGLSLVDCVSFETMRAGGITCAFTFDRHFTEQGFQVIP
jgi:predicted nucleic acid-binding protein